MKKKSYSKMRKIITNLIVIGLFSGLASLKVTAASLEHEQYKAEHTLAMPAKALISPHEATLDVTQEVSVKTIDGQARLEFVIPEDASNLRINIPGHTIARWSSTPVILQASSTSSSKRARLENERDAIIGQLTTLKAQLSVWQAQTGNANPQDLEKRQSLMAQEMPALSVKHEELQRKLDLVQQELSELPASPGIGQLIIVTLTSNSKPSDKVRIDYNYNLQRCGWQAVYDFNATPDSGEGDLVDVHLLAEVWQYTGMDWSGTEITLATLGNGPREPQPLRKWIVGAPTPAPHPQPRAAANTAHVRNAQQTLSLKAAAPEAMAASDAADMPVELAAPVVANTDAIYANWTLASKGLPEGRSRIAISNDTWKTPLQWLSRPSTDDNRVWLFAKYDLPANQAWPAGIAQFSVDGQSVGNGNFNPKGREVILYFGADPRMYVRTVIDTNRQGQTGFINTSKTWTGAWTYIINNEHAKPVKVRVERPAPMVANENITVSYKDQPASQMDEKEHMVYWDVTVPAHGKTNIEHSVTISSPEKLPLLPDVP